MSAERNKARSEAAAAGRTADKLTAQIAARSKASVQKPCSTLHEEMRKPLRQLHLTPGMPAQIKHRSELSFGVGCTASAMLRRTA